MTTSPLPSQLGGQLWVQTTQVDFLHRPTSSYAPVTEVPTLTIPYPGWWEVSYHARLVVQQAATTYTDGWVGTALFLDRVLIDGSQAVAGIGAAASVRLENTIGQTFMFKFDGGEVVALNARAIGQAAAWTVQSNSDGRTQIMAHFVSPRGDQSP
ncbi:hypothetical protein [Streptantibioticus ferralitis]|uniref:Uncharacterized protein n=1 Tax=Streptantibioticus ferralitis TaxID=236510 RepID=A0ABT5Z426_9ACTN|nr:hypothetical protein [Streptantibioticus ferralitis]MDF2258581.1 hypothetical protein [Streptantibioticus ferralitis]